MTWQIDAIELERAIVRHCSPTLAGLKPASLFTFPGGFCASATDDPEAASQRRRALVAAMALCRRQIASAGLEIRVLAWKRCGALVYVYRPQALARTLSQTEAEHVLNAIGYRTGDLESCLELLGARLGDPAPATQTAHGATPCPCEQEACAQSFPHEIGFFLGYPAADVVGFIENRGKNSIACGPWKVYANKDEALRTFARYRRCSHAYARAYRNGRKLAGLAVSARI